MTQIKSKLIQLFYPTLIFLALMSMQACDSRSYVAEKEFEGACWTISDTLNFQMKAVDGQSLPLFLQFNPEYIFQNIYLKLQYQKAGEAVQEHLIREILSDPLGNWKQELSSGLYSFELPQELKLEAGDYQFQLFQYMREDNLCGVHKVGILQKP